MTELDVFDPLLRRRVGQSLGELLADHAEAEALARTLAPDGSGPGVRYHEYETTLRAPQRRTAYQRAFPDIAAFRERLEAGDPGALEFAFELGARLDPERGVPLVALLLPNQPWKMLGMALGRALGACASEESFLLLLDHPHVPYFRDGLSTNRYAGGVTRAWAAYEAYGDVGSADLEPRARVEALPILAYLLCMDPARAMVETVRLSGEPNHEIGVFVTHRLLNLDTEQSVGVLLARLDETPPGAPLAFPARMGVRVLLAKDARTAVDRLGGLEHLLTKGGRPRLQALLSWLSWDTFPSGGHASAGWLERDPQFASLVAVLRTDPERDLAQTAGYLLRALPMSAKAHLPKPSRKAQRRRAEPPNDALLQELATQRDALAQLVQKLRASGYQFVDPKRALTKPSAKGKRAIAKLEKNLGPLPPALTAFWTVVGSIDLRGQHSSWPSPACLALPGVREEAGVWLTDPLVVAAPEDIVDDALEAFVEGTPYGLPLAPDATGKAGYSGGALRVYVPSKLEDPPVEGGTRVETFLAHLRHSLTWSGLPGLEAVGAPAEAWLRGLQR